MHAVWVKAKLHKIQATTRDKPPGVVRIFLGFMFLSTGSMKLLVPILWTAWSGQLTAAQISFYRFNLWFVPIAEILIGLLFLFGWMSRLAGVVAIAIMGVATYVHLVVKDPTLFLSKMTSSAFVKTSRWGSAGSRYRRERQSAPQ